MKPLEAIPITSAAGAPRDWLAAAVWSMILSLLFVCIYGSCLWITDHRANVPTLMFDWEWGIPLVEWMIVPYVSIDLFFIAAPFVCASEQELATLVRRLTFVIFVAGACFLLFPLKMGLVRPEVDGAFAGSYMLLGDLDRPYNLVPSLHIAQWAILWTVYGRHTRGVLRWITLAWFTLIGVSTLLTWQHQVLDVVTGQALGLMAIYLIRERSDARAAARDEAPVTRNVRLAARYGLVAIGLAVAGWALRPWGLVLLWPATSFGVMALAYVSFGPAIFRKEDGRLDTATRFVLGPYLFAAWLTFPRYRRRSAAWARVTENVIVGRRVGAREAQRLIDDERVTAVLDLTCECAAPRPFERLAYRNVPVLDLTVPTPQQFRAGVAFIRAHVRTDGKVYVHCALGYSRSASIVAAYLFAEGHAPTAADAVAIIRAARPQILVPDAAVRAIDAFVQAEDRKLRGIENEPITTSTVLSPACS